MIIYIFRWSFSSPVFVSNIFIEELLNSPFITLYYIILGKLGDGIENQCQISCVQLVVFGIMSVVCVCFRVQTKEPLKSTLVTWAYFDHISGLNKQKIIIISQLGLFNDFVQIFVKCKDVNIILVVIFQIYRFVCYRSTIISSSMGRIKYLNY